MADTSYRPTWMQPLKARSPLKLVTEDLNKQRSAFHIDTGVLTHSLVVKRLVHKTQVHSLVENDHIRTRLTHSLETANIGRQIARYFCRKLNDKKVFNNELTYFMFQTDLEELTFAACLAHDIGHPPFGHVGA